MGAEILGISFDSVAENREFARTEGFPYRLLSDADRKVGTTYGVLRAPDDPYPDFALRFSFLIDPAGVVRKVYEVTDRDAHAGEVLADLRQLLAQ